MHANPYASVYKGFLRETAKHQLTVIHDEGVYRHLRVQSPGTRIWSWDLVTWPGHLITSGDIGAGFLFHRLEDMIVFFDGARQNYYSDGAPSIDFRYWAEKVVGPGQDGIKAYARERFVELVREALEGNETVGLGAQASFESQMALLHRIYEVTGASKESLRTNLDAYRLASITGNDAARTRKTLWRTDNLTDDQVDTLTQTHGYDELSDTEIPSLPPEAKRAELIQEARWNSDDEQDAHAWLRRNEEWVGADTWEWDLRDWSHQFLYACYAINFTVQAYVERHER